MYNSNQVVKSFEYQFQIFISRVNLKTKFPCQFYTSLRYRPQLPELVSPEVVSINGQVQFNHTHRFTLFMNSKGEQNEEKKATLTVGLRSKHRPLEKIIAGFVTIDLSNYTKYSHPLKTFKIERCPDQDSLIEIAIKSNKIRESICLENEQKSITKVKYHKSQIFTEFKEKQKDKPLTKRSCILNKSVNQDEGHDVTNISREFSKLLVRNGNKNIEQGNMSRLLTPDKQGNCQLSFAKLKDSCVSRSLNYDEVRQSSDMSEVSNFKVVGGFEQKNREIYQKLIASEKERMAQDAYIKQLQKQLKNMRQREVHSQKVQRVEKSTTECSSDNNIFTQKQISSMILGSTIACIQKDPSCSTTLGDISLLERNSSLIKTITNLKSDLETPIKQIQLILQNQLEQYEQDSSWEALRLLQTITEKLSLS